MSRPRTRTYDRPQRPPGSQPRMCDHPGCHEVGEFRAPGPQHFDLNQDAIRESLRHFFMFNDEPPVRPRRPPTPEEEALAVLELGTAATGAEIKARYKVLVKRHHPDANGGDKAAEER